MDSLSLSVVGCKYRYVLLALRRCDTGFTLSHRKDHMHACVAMLLIELQSPMVSVGNTIRTQMFHDESTRSKQINQLNIRAAKHLKETTIKRDEKPQNGERNST